MSRLPIACLLAGSRARGSAWLFQLRSPPPPAGPSGVDGACRIMITQVLGCKDFPSAHQLDSAGPDKATPADAHIHRGVGHSSGAGSGRARLVWSTDARDAIRPHASREREREKKKYARRTHKRTHTLDDEGERGSCPAPPASYAALLVLPVRGSRNLGSVPECIPQGQPAHSFAPLPFPQLS